MVTELQWVCSTLIVFGHFCINLDAISSYQVGALQRDKE